MGAYRRPAGAGRHPRARFGGPAGRSAIRAAPRAG